MKSRSILPIKGQGDKTLATPKFASVDPSEEDEARLSKLARDHNFSNRDPSGVGRSDTDAAADTDARPERGAERPFSLIPARPVVVDEVALTKDELKAKYAKLLEQGKPLPMPDDLNSANIQKHRFYQMMPAHVAAALEALTEANGYDKEWKLIAEMMRRLGAIDGQIE